MGVNPSTNNLYRKRYKCIITNSYSSLFVFFPLLIGCCLLMTICPGFKFIARTSDSTMYIFCYFYMFFVVPTLHELRKKILKLISTHVLNCVICEFEIPLRNFIFKTFWTLTVFFYLSLFFIIVTYEKNALYLHLIRIYILIKLFLDYKFIEKIEILVVTVFTKQ